jgi:hypothetical protein
MMKLIKNNYYYFKFAGQTLLGEYIKTQTLYEGTIVNLFKDKQGFIYPIRKENICGNLKQ